MIYRFDLTCWKCGGPMRHITAGSADARSTEQRAVARCDTCRQDWIVAVILRPAAGGEAALDRQRGDGAICGTAYGYRQHLERGEPTCNDCRSAWRIAGSDRDRRSRTKARQEVA